MRVKDETIITDAEDDEIKGEQNIDEFSKYFEGVTTPRILMTTNRRPRGVSQTFIDINIDIENLLYALSTLWKQCAVSRAVA